MSSFPPINQIAGHNYNVFEALYKQANPSGTATIGANQCASLLKRSGLSEGVLHDIWELADQDSRGYLDKQGFFVALKLIALAQSSKEMALANLTVTCSPPKLGDSPRPLAPPPSDAGNWIIKQAEKQKYDGIFENLQPVNGFVSGDKVKPVLMNSKLPVDVLGRVWAMADIDKDGMLDKDEFAVAMHLVYRALDGEAVPTVLAPGLVPPSKRGVTSSAAVVSSISSGSYSPRTTSTSTSSSTPAKPWVVTPTEKAKFDAMFAQADTNKDGLVAGPEVKSIFMASGLPQPMLAHIWGLCDIKNTGLLNAEQFALAMYLITNKRRNNVDPPTQLSQEMIPPSIREKDDVSSLSSNLAALQAKDFAAIKELDQINQEIEKLGREKVALQQEIEQTEETIRKRKTEIEDLQSELSKTEKSTQELQLQKNEAQEKLNSVENEKSKYEGLLTELRQSCEDEKQTIANLRVQISSQESSLKNQEEEFAAARKELNELREEESKLEQQLQTGKTQLDQIKKSMLSTKNDINQMRTKIAKLTEENQTLNASINQYSAMTNTISSSSASSTPVSMSEGLSALPENLEATFAHSDVDQISARATAGSSPVSSISGFSVGSGSGRVDDANDEDFKDQDPFKPKSDVFSGNESENADPFHTEDPFKQDPFKTVSFAGDPFSGDPFHDKDPFRTDHEKNEDDIDPFKSDPFKPVATSAAPSSSSTTQANRPLESAADPFSSLDPFGSGAFAAPKTSKSSAADPFSSDPFAPVTAATESATSSKKSSVSSTQVDPKDDPFFGGSSQAAWSDPFGSSHDDPFASTGTKSVGKADDPWSAFSDDNSKAASALDGETLDWGTTDNKLEEKTDMDVALALKQSVESSSEA